MLAKVETVSGTDAVPVVATDAVLVENPQSSPNLLVVETNEVTGTLDDRGPLPAGGSRPMTFDVWLKGAGTAGTAPEYGALLRGCAMLETLLAAPLTGTAVAAAAGTITLTAGAGTTVQIGMTVSITAGTGIGQTRVITAKTGDVMTVFPDWTTIPTGGTYTIAANAIYRPTSTDLKTVTIYRYRHRSDAGLSKLDTVIGAGGTFTLSMPVRNPGRMSFNFQGQLVEPTDVAAPGAAVYDNVRPFPYLNAQTFLGTAAAAIPIKLNTLTFDMGDEVQLIDNPAQAFGYDAAGITRRRVSGRFNPPLEITVCSECLRELARWNGFELLGSVRQYVREYRLDLHSAGSVHWS